MANPMQASREMPEGAISTDGIEEIVSIARQEWRSYLEPMLDLGARLVPAMVHPDDPQLRRELYRGAFSQMAAAYLGLLFADARHPDFWPFVTPSFTFAGGNPDHDYYVTPIDDSGVYRISGFRGTVKRVDAQIGTGTFFSRGVLDAQKLGLTLANYDFDSLQQGAGGSLEVVLSRERPAGWQGDWWALGEGATYLLMRQTSYDWINEVDGRFAIERIDVPAAKPRPTAGELESNLQQIAKWTEATTAFSIAFAQGICRDQGVNQMRYKDLTQYGELVTQKYAYGAFDLAPGEALIVEADVPTKCRYWSIHLMDDHGFTVDWVNRQTLINGHTGVVDRDGIFRAVISAEDPGTPNWLDTMGYRSGVIQARWEECSSWPDHRVKKIAVKDVRSHLPPETGTVTLEERDATIRARRRGAQMRKRW